MTGHDVAIPQSPSAPRRNQYSCRQCRKDKQRCSPTSRDWEKKFEKCRRCTILGHECSPPERAAGRFTKKRSMVAIACKMQGVVDVPESSAPILDLPDASISTWPSSARFEDDSMELDSCDVRNNSLYSIYSCASSVYQHKERIGRSDQARKSIIKLGDLNATREMLRRTLGQCDLIESWLDMSVSQKSTIQTYIIAIERMFKIETQKVVTCVTKGLDNEHDTQLMVYALLLIVYRFDHPLDYSGSANVCIDDHILLQLSRISRQARTLYSEADLVCASRLGISMRYDLSTAAEQRYTKASDVVTKILNAAILDDMEQRTTLSYQGGRGFPPCHVAYMHGNENAALALWEPHESDMLGRTLLHLAAYAADTQMIRRLLDHDSEAVHGTPADVFGLTPLAIAACSKEEIGCFSVLWQSGADRSVLDLKGRSVLALAVRNGNSKAVSIILQEGITIRSQCHELLEAVQSNDDDIVIEILMDFYIQRPDCINLKILSEADRIARQRGSMVIVQALERGTSMLAWNLKTSRLSYHESGSYEGTYPNGCTDANSVEGWEVLKAEDSPIQYLDESLECNHLQAFAGFPTPFLDFAYTENVFEACQQ